MYSRFKGLVGASEIFPLNRISLISKDTFLFIEIIKKICFNWNNPLFLTDSTAKNDFLRSDSLDLKLNQTIL